MHFFMIGMVDVNKFSMNESCYHNESDLNEIQKLYISLGDSLKIPFHHSPGNLNKEKRSGHPALKKA